ncbi:CynX/NimT family MFS transporter [Bradyrhizobium elkanii]|uniref:MFS transporter n=2 Tax=Bradyrhizobium elkanii TaxID=29448 RepID=UPI00216822FF|nr:MFS transporter [Bradyrhizobium elkanii]MCS3517532.1 putative MFS family arabinose efflux permease [Bradyrhizobium elkanii]MCS4074088.1 putative MFS family arabinose efflux permease [Bradyrhizobium elkanii]MCS4080722.1 putative MFS family arabinose efflux permease [Bradyrhizobium elkanii]MCW2129696.1 putative MFS family arabinose efflux permease [Bradyrhizobium elkanii]MCW2167373.1 putative MFS family arabinose efflux permease [Bradyrhizobium elkanii]
MTIETAVMQQSEAKRWATIAIVIGCGIGAALQVGKVPIAASMLQQSLGIDLAAVGTIAGIFAVLGLVGSVPAGVVIAAVGARRVLLCGLAAITLGAGSGALAPQLAVLLASRLLEGLGFLLVMVAAPALLDRVVDVSARDVTMAVWSCVMPFGIALALVAGPIFDGWRTIWWAGAAFAGVLFILASLIAPEVASRTGPARANLMQEATALAQRRTPALLMVLFALYSMMFFALFSFLPILLTERLGVSSQGAGALSALAAAGNVVGNLAAGHLLARGVSRNLLIAVAAFATGASALGIFLPVLGGWGAFWLCLLFSAIGGLIPATLLATAPAAARSAAMVPVMMGLLMTGSNFGQVTGPIAVGAVVSASGWGAACVMVVAAAILAGLAAWMLARGDHKRVSDATDPA